MSFAYSGRPLPHVTEAWNFIRLTGSTGKSARPTQRWRPIILSCLWACISLLLADGDVYAAEPHGGMMRFPDVSASHIAFTYADDIWLVPRSGGTATPLASPPGAESFPRFSRDGRQIAFSANYDGNLDIYTVPIEGGIPQRVTFYSNGERLCDWTFDDRLVFALNGLAGLRRQAQLFTVDRDGGLPEQLPVPYGGYGVISGDGQWLAYTPRNRDFRTWKRYRGGLASDIWLFHLTEHTSKKITDWEGTDTIPMWQGETLYYLSDAGPNHRLNIWSVNVKTEARQQITHFKDYDVKWPSHGPGPQGNGEIVFEYNAKLYLHDLERGEAAPVNITVPGARPRLRPIRKDVSGRLQNHFVSPRAKRVLVESRGDVWSLPATKGSPRNLTRTSGVAEREPSWSPDGKWMTYFSDESGEYALVMRPADSSGPPETVTSYGAGFRYQPVWAPNSKWLVFTDHESRFHLFHVEERETRDFDRIDISGWDLRISPHFSWSADSQWLAYTKPNEDNMSVLMLYNVLNDTSHQVTRGMFVDYLPTFDRQGDFLYFFSNREFSRPTHADTELTFVFDKTAILHAMPLRPDVENPLRVESDEETDEDEDEDEEKDEDEGTDEGTDEDQEEGDDNDEEDQDKEEETPGEEEDSDDEDAGDEEESDSDNEEDENGDDGQKKDDEEEVEPVEIELDGLESRAFRLPVERGNFSFLAVNDKHHLIYLRQGEEPVLQIFDPADEKREEKKVLADVRRAQITPDGKKLLVTSGSKTGIIHAAADQKLEKTLVTEPMTVVIEPREEWAQIFADAWRFMRDFFYDPNMHGVDWPAVRKQYEAMLEDCASRRDVGYIISEMISEVNAGHTYYGGGDVDSGPSRPIGFLGVDFEVDQGFYRIREVYQGGPWDTDARSVLHDLTEEERESFRYLFAVNGVQVDVSQAPWAAFEGLSDQTVILSVGPKPDPEEATDVVVKLRGSERELRYRNWVESNRRYVEEKSDGKVGYIYVPDTGGRGQRELFRQFYGQMNREALIIDERWNSGGNIADRYIELLNRPIFLHLFERYEKDWRVPTLSHQGPKCMLINGDAGSGGDIFPYLFRKAGLGKLIGMRTWGGVIGIARNPPFIDGGRITVPFITFYETDGTLTMEGHGVDPDIEVVDDPALMVDGGDPQLDAAIEHMLEEIEKNPYAPAQRPPYPQRRGMGIAEEDK